MLGWCTEPVGEDVAEEAEEMGNPGRELVAIQVWFGALDAERVVKTVG